MHTFRSESTVSCSACNAPSGSIVWINAFGMRDYYVCGESAHQTVCKFYAAATLLQSPDPHAVTAPSVTLGTLGPHPAASEGAWAPYATAVAERRLAALRFSDFWMARAPFSTQAVERRCA